MAAGRDPGSFDLYVVLHPYQDVIADFKRRLRPLGGGSAEQLAGIEGYYCAEIDSAILNLRFRREFAEVLGTPRLFDLCGHWGRPLIAPETLPPPERDAFFLDHLSRYGTYVQLYPSRDDPTPLLLRILDNLSEHVRIISRARARSEWSF